MATVHARNQQKRRRLSELLEQGKVLIHVNPSVEGVSLPEQLMDDDSVPLFLSYRFANEVFEVGLNEVRVTLIFSGVQTLCILPWPSIFYISLATDPEDASLFFADFPPALLSQRILDEEIPNTPEAWNRGASAEEESAGSEHAGEKGEGEGRAHEERPFVETLDRLSASTEELRLRRPVELFKLLQGDGLHRDELSESTEGELEDDEPNQWRAQLESYQRGEVPVFPREPATVRVVSFDDYMARKKQREAIREQARAAEPAQAEPARE